MIYNITLNGLKIAQAVRVMCPDGWQIVGYDGIVVRTVFKTKREVIRWLSDNYDPAGFEDDADYTLTRIR